MMPEIYVGYDPLEGEKPVLFLAITHRMQVIAVNEEGAFLATITGENGYCINAKQSIEDSGYSTAWAEWDEDGRFVRLT